MFEIIYPRTKLIYKCSKNNLYAAVLTSIVIPVCERGSPETTVSLEGQTAIFGYQLSNILSVAVPQVSVLFHC
jgi:hypothetical protein